MSMQSSTPIYWQQACKQLAIADPLLKNVINSYQGESLQCRGDAFFTLARSIVGQQISVKAAQTIWNRLETAVAQIHAEQLLETDTEELRNVGLSQRKVSYLQALAKYFIENPQCESQWRKLSDQLVIEALQILPGIGRWTAEMFLIFCLLRPNVLPLGDVGLLLGVGKLYFQGKKASTDQVKQVAQRWQPYSSVATWYIWRSLDPLPVIY